MEIIPLQPEHMAQPRILRAIIRNRMREIGMRVDEGNENMDKVVEILTREMYHGARIVVCQTIVPYDGEEKLWTDGKPEDAPLGTPCAHFNWKTFPPNGKEV